MFWGQLNVCAYLIVHSGLEIEQAIDRQTLIDAAQENSSRFFDHQFNLFLGLYPHHYLKSSDEGGGEGSGDGGGEGSGLGSGVTGLGVGYTMNENMI